ncbi:hypothetical protein TNCV_1848951 [Trichonephila clavipes]|nr:hypothetical protein TNCV_1848951 [Trichonephila clavipes]
MRAYNFRVPKIVDVANPKWARHQKFLGGPFQVPLLFNYFLFTHAGAPVARGPRIIDTAVATHLPATLDFQDGHPTSMLPNRPTMLICVYA